MDDMISRQQAIDAVMKLMPSLTTPDGSGQFDTEIFRMQEMFVDIGQVLNDLTSADAVEVVRCKDCKHFVRSEGVCKLLSNNYEPPVYVDDDDFCSRGERRKQ